MSAVMTVKDWMHGHHGVEHGLSMRVVHAMQHLAHNDRFWWGVLAVSILILFVALAIISLLRGVSTEWLRPMPQMLYPYPYMV